MAQLVQFSSLKKKIEKKIEIFHSNIPDKVIYSIINYVSTYNFRSAYNTLF